MAAAAGVSRTLLYRDADLRAEIDRLRGARTSTPARPSAQRASIDSLRRRLEAAQDDIRTLRAENASLLEHIAVLLGEQRAAAAPRGRASTRTIGPCS